MRFCALLLVLVGCGDPGAGDGLDPDIGGPIRLPGVDGAIFETGDADDDQMGDDDAAAGPDVFHPPEGGCGDIDEDGDGYGTQGLCTPVDCDDDNAAIRPGAFEACNGVDEDCDDVVDEGLNTAICGVGACRREVPNCAEGRPQRCTPAEPSAEVCNEIDDDCDGTVDEEASAETCGVGACARRASCADGGACTPGAPAGEQCNNIDDDCDGVVDNGFRAQVVTSSYSALIGRHPNCDGSRERIGPNCNAAMNRLCGATACVTSGFGPVENSGDTSIVTCVLTEAPHNVPFATLAGHHDGCNSNRERIGPQCNAAIHRYCASRGFVSGFGPVESGADFLTVACVSNGAQAVGTRYSVMTQHHPPCDGNGQRIGPDCNAAIHRFCRSLGHASGFGPVENSGDDLAVICVSP